MEQLTRSLTHGRYARIRMGHLDDPWHRVHFLDRSYSLTLNMTKEKRQENQMYTSKNFKTKKELKEAIVRGEKITIYQPGPFGGNEPLDGTVVLEGPHYPEPHRWYATATIKRGIIISVK